MTAPALGALGIQAVLRRVCSNLVPQDLRRYAPPFQLRRAVMSKKTFLQVQQQIKELQVEAERLRREEAADVLARIKEAIAVYGFTAVDLGLSGPAGRSRKAAAGNTLGTQRRRVSAKVKKATPKFRDADGNEWSGRGPRPAWFRAALEAGKTPEDFLVS